MRVVIDTNVLFEGLTKQGGTCAWIVEAWDKALLQACVSNILTYEYADMLERKSSKPRWNQAEPVLVRLLARAFITLGGQALPIPATITSLIVR